MVRASLCNKHKASFINKEETNREERVCECVCLMSGGGGGCK